MKVKNRITDIIETLKRVPLPNEKGQVITMPVFEETWMQKIELGKSARSRTIREITLTAEIFNDGSKTWLEWTM